MNNMDIIFFILLIILVSSIIGLNIISVIDKKMTQVAINIPSIEIPKSDVFVKVDRSQMKCDTQINYDYNKNNQNTEEKQNTENNQNNQNNVNKENNRNKDYKKMEHFGNLKDNIPKKTSIRELSRNPVKCDMKERKFFKLNQKPIKLLPANYSDFDVFMKSNDNQFVLDDNLERFCR